MKQLLNLVFDEHKKYRYSIYLLISSVFLFLTLLTIVCNSNRMGSGDDLFFYLSLQEKGIFQSLIDFEYNTRFVSFFSFNAVFFWEEDFAKLPWLIFIFHFLFFSGIYFSIYFFLSSFVKSKVQFGFFKTDIFVFSGLIFILLFFGAPQLIDNWFWIIASLVYTFPIIFFFIGATLLFMKKLNYISKGLFCLCFLLIGGCLETYALSVGAFLTFILLISYKYNFLRYIRKRIYLGIPCLLFFISINVIFGKMSSRHEFEQSYTSDYVSGIDFLDSFFDGNNVFILLVLVVFYFFGKLIEFKLPTPIEINIKRIALYNFIFLLICWLLTMLPLFIVFNDWGPARAWFPFHFFLLLSLVFWSIWLGIKFPVNFNPFHSISMISVFLIVLFSIIIKSQWKPLRNYSINYDKQVNELSINQNALNGDVFFWKKLPETTYGVGFQLSSDSLSGKNRNLAKVLRMNCSIVQK